MATRWGALHMGRAWSGHEIEDACPCPKAPCGLVDFGQPLPFCDQHNPENPLAARTIRQAHDPAHCPALDNECPRC